METFVRYRNQKKYTVCGQIQVTYILIGVTFNAGSCPDNYNLKDKIFSTVISEFPLLYYAIIKMY